MKTEVMVSFCYISIYMIINMYLIYEKVRRILSHPISIVFLSRTGFGMSVMVHDNTQLPLIDVAGMQMGTDLQYRLTYTKKTVTSLPSPYSTCTSQIPLAMSAMFDNYKGADYAYSEDICYLLCEQAYT